MNRRELPPIFARVRFQIPKEHMPPVLALVSRDHIQEAREAIKAMVPNIDVPLSIWHHAWLETPVLGMLCRSYEGSTTREDYTDVLAWNVRDKNPVKYRFTGFDTGDLDDLGIIVKAQFYQAAYALHTYTEREAEVSVNTMTRNSPRAYLRQGDTIRFVPASSLASAAGQSRQRDYQRPEEHSGIRMREHDVRGHWRTFSTGVRVWVRPHKRGDAELGRVTRVIR